MLDVMRRHSQSFLIYLVFGVVIFIFVTNFNPAGGSCLGGPGGSSWAAKVGGDIIRQQDFAVNYSQRLESARRSAQQSGSDFTAEMAEQLGLKQRVIDEMIDRKLLSQEAKRWGLRVSDDELRQHLEEDYGLKGVSYADYEGRVNQAFQMSVSRFEEQVRDELLAQKMVRFVSDNVAVSDEELRESYLRDYDRAMAWFVQFDPAQIQVPEPSNEQVAALLTNQPKEVEARYNDEIGQYRTPMTVRARQIVRKLAPDAPDADVAKEKALLADLRGQVAGGADFGALAKEHSQDEATANAGGDMGTFKRGQLAKPLEDAAFTLQKDQMSLEAIRTPVGLHLIQVTEINQPVRREFDEVKREVAQALLLERAQEEKAQQAANAVLAQLQSGSSLESLTVADTEARDAPPTGATLVRKETPWIIKGNDTIPRLGSSKALHDEIFGLTKEAPVAKQVHKVGRTFVLVVLKDREIPDTNKFAESKNDLRQQATWTKRAKVLRDWVAHLRKNADVKLNPAVFARQEAA